jgi:hypothetical protein
LKIHVDDDEVEVNEKGGKFHAVAMAEFFCD